MPDDLNGSSGKLRHVRPRVSANHITNPTCTAGSCGGNCDAGFADCDLNKQTTGCEIDINGDAMNCGGCGMRSRRRRGGGALQRRRVQRRVPVGLRDCNGSSWPTAARRTVYTDPDNCVLHAACARPECDSRLRPPPA